MKRWVERCVVVCAIGAIALALMCLDHGAPDSSVGFAPPALYPAGHGGKLDLNRFPAQTEEVEVALASGEKLRGVFVPSDPGAPVVVHLLESGASVVGGGDLLGVTRCAFTDLSGLGFASLALDYRGIGASDGERSVDHLADDAWAMWREAVRRAGGREDLVVIRATSIGTIAAALVLARGAQPGAIVLFDPVESESVAARFASAEYGFAAGWLAQAIFRPVANVDVKATLARVTAPLLVITPEDEALLSKREQRKLRASVESARGRWVVDQLPFRAPDELFGHCWVASRSRDMIANDECDLLRTAFPDWPDLGARSAAMLAQADASAHAAMSMTPGALERLARACVDLRCVPPNSLAAMAVLGWPAERIRRFASENASWPIGWSHVAAFDDWIELLDRRDPSGDLPYGWIDCWPGMRFTVADSRDARVRTPIAPTPLVSTVFEVETMLECARRRPGVAPVTWMREASIDDADVTRLHVVWTGEQLAEPDARRQLARMLLKGAGLPDRVVADERGSHLEAKECGEWKRVDLERPEPKESPADPKVTASEH